MDASQANQHDRVVHVVVGEIVDVRRCREQIRAALEIDADGERVRLGCPVARNAGEHFATDLESGRSVGSTFFYIGKSEADLPHGIEVDVFSRHKIPEIILLRGARACHERAAGSLLR